MIFVFHRARINVADWHGEMQSNVIECVRTTTFHYQSKLTNKTSIKNLNMEFNKAKQCSSFL